MAPRSDPGRRGERGLSIIEALVIVTITALLALILLPLVAGSAARNFDRSALELDSADSARAGAAFRRIVSASSLVGRPSERRLVLDTSLSNAVACAEAGRGEVMLRLVDSGDLVCESRSGRSVLIRQSSDHGGFEFSDDGRLWARRWHAGSAPRFVRFSLEASDAAGRSWFAALATAERQDPALP
jgi:type II secretory pathway pseudopilin PulG